MGPVNILLEQRVRARSPSQRTPIRPSADNSYLVEMKFRRLIAVDPNLDANCQDSLGLIWMYVQHKDDQHAGARDEQRKGNEAGCVGTSLSDRISKHRLSCSLKSEGMRSD